MTKPDDLPPLPFADLRADRRRRRFRPADSAVQGALIVLSAAGRSVSPAGTDVEVDGVILTIREVLRLAAFEVSRVGLEGCAGGLAPEQIWEGAIYVFRSDVRRVLRCDRVFVTWEFVATSYAPPGHLVRAGGGAYAFTSDLRRFAAAARHELVPPRRAFTGGCWFAVGEIPPGAPARRTSARQPPADDSALPDSPRPGGGAWPLPIGPVWSEVRP